MNLCGESSGVEDAAVAAGDVAVGAGAGMGVKHKPSNTNAGR